MKQLKLIYKFMASLKFALPMLLLWIACMTAGTFIESAYGSRYALRLIYHSLGFYLVETALVLSLIFSFIERMPFKKRLMGFYVVHISLISLMVGAWITHQYGIDGTLELHPSTPASTVQLDQDVLWLHSSTAQSFTPLPSSAFASSLGETLPLPGGAQLRLVQYLPFARPVQAWKNSPGSWVSRWQLEILGENGGEGGEFALASPPQADIGPRAMAGNLAAELLPQDALQGMQNALIQTNTAWVLHDTQSHQIQSVAAKQKGKPFKMGGQTFTLSEGMNQKVNLSFIVLKTPEGEFKYFPRFSSAPLLQHMQLDEGARYRLYDLSLVRRAGGIFISKLADQSFAVLSGIGTDWNFQIFRNGKISLQVFNAELTLLSDETGKVPDTHYVSGAPESSEEQVRSAIQLELKVPNSEPQTLWLGSNQEIDLTDGMKASLGRKQITLPFALVLQKFNMDKIPGTERPASFQSLVKVEGEPETITIEMNQPLKRAGMTLYQSSYYQGEQGEFHSVLMVNQDPGRWLKYAASIFLVIGLILFLMTASVKKTGVKT